MFLPIKRFKLVVIVFKGSTFVLVSRGKIIDGALQKSIVQVMVCYCFKTLKGLLLGH